MSASSLERKLSLLSQVQRCSTILLFEKYVNISLQYIRKPSRFYSYSASIFANFNFNLGTLVYFLYFEQ